IFQVDTSTKWYGLWGDHCIQWFASGLVWGVRDWLHHDLVAGCADPRLSSLDPLSTRRLVQFGCRCRYGSMNITGKGRYGSIDMRLYMANRQSCSAVV
ncbi:hypothetical protein LSAT2_007255, partial [Lamellibrachia satsuma]